MSIDFKRIIGECESLFEYMISEKDKFLNKAQSIKLSAFAIGSIVILISIMRSFDLEYLKAGLITSAILISLVALSLISIKNDSILPSESRRKFYYTYKKQLVGNIIKNVSDKLIYKPQNRILNHVISDSKLFENITEYKGRNLIQGSFDKAEFQMSELQLWKGLKRVFNGVFIYASSIDIDKLDTKVIEDLKGSWTVNNGNLYIAFDDISKLFEVKLERSNRSIEKIKIQIEFITEILNLIDKASNISFFGSIGEPTVPSSSYESIQDGSIYKGLETNIIYKLAPNSKRFYNLIIDQLVISGISALLFYIASQVFHSAANELLLIIVFVLVQFIYYFSLETSCSRTIGKLITRTKTISITGNKPKPSIILLRTICRYIPYEAYSFINNDIGMHDKLSKTIVIQEF